jgi:hypothetical protein
LLAAGEWDDSSNGDGGRNRQSTNTAGATSALTTATVDAPPPPVVIVHDTAWYEDEDATKRPINGYFPEEDWYVTNSINVHFGVGSDHEQRLSQLD